MLAVHWSPVSNSKHIIKSGITKSKKGLYCFPLTGNRNVDTWWVRAFNQYKFRKNRNSYNGFIFRIDEAYLPAYFGHWIGATSRDEFEKPINTLEELEREFRETVLFRIGERIGGYKILQDYDDCMRLAIEELKSDPRTYNMALQDNELMEYAFEDCQIVLSKSVPAKKIIKIISPQNEFGRVLYKSKRESHYDDEL